MEHTELCHDCRIEKGYKRKDKGAHTARTKKCACCGDVKGILPDRHWVKD